MTSRDQSSCASGRLLLLAALLVGSGPALANQALARKHGCLGCHAVTTTLVGPAYQQVAEKYGGDKDALPALIKRIREGGSGTWGEIAMPPQPQVSAADAKRLAQWILGGAK